VDDFESGIAYVKLSGPTGLIKSNATPVEDLIFELLEIISE
jgi:hypothetical protein